MRYCLACLLFVSVDSLLAQPESKGKLVKEFHHSFKDNPAAREGFELFGPDAAKCVRFDKDGLRISLPAGHKGIRRPTGVETLIDVGGDFEITVTFEVLAEPAPAGGKDKQTRFTLDIVLDKPGLNAASLSRTIYGKGVETVTWSALQPEGAEKAKTSMHYFPATAKSMRLRLVRTGASLAYDSSAGDNQDFVRLREDPFGTENLNKVRCVASTGSADAELEVRVTDLRIRAESLDRTTGEDDDAATNPRVYWMLLIAAVILLMGAGFALRRRAKRAT